MGGSVVFTSRCSMGLRAASGLILQVSLGGAVIAERDAQILVCHVQGGFFVT